jgi:hypothetical protein
MLGLRVWIILTWIALPTVMYGGYSLLQLMNRGDVLTPVEVNLFRAGHAHAKSNPRSAMLNIAQPDP